MVDAGAMVALSTDLNPGSAPCLSMPLVMAIACRYQKLLPSEVLNASTINAAHAIGLGAQNWFYRGWQAGRPADIKGRGLSSHCLFLWQQSGRNRNQARPDHVTQPLGD